MIKFIIYFLVICIIIHFILYYLNIDIMDLYDNEEKFKYIIGFATVLCFSHFVISMLIFIMRLTMFSVRFSRFHASKY